MWEKMHLTLQLLHTFADAIHCLGVARFVAAVISRRAIGITRLPDGVVTLDVTVEGCCGCYIYGNKRERAQQQKIVEKLKGEKCLNYY